MRHRILGLDPTPLKRVPCVRVCGLQNCGGPKLLGTNDVLYLSDESIPQATGGNAASLKVLVKGAKTADLNLYQTGTVSAHLASPY